MNISPRILAQFKCIEKFKFEESKSLNRELDWDEAGRLWVEYGYAKVFSEEYDEQQNVMKIYQKISEKINR